MGVSRCSAGHFFDDIKYQQCPHCNKENNRALEEKTISHGAYSGCGSKGALNRKMVELALQGTRKMEEEKTIGIFRLDKGEDPIVGWLVCVEGRERGRDFRLHAGRNMIGRALTMDISLVDDERISRENHCSIVFEPKKAMFMILKGEGDGLIVNDDRVSESQMLSADDVIQIGSSKFIFIPFCKEGRIWHEDSNT